MTEALYNRWKLVFKEMTIEPAMLLLMIGIGVSSVVGDTMFITRVCSITLNISDTVCKNLSSHEAIEKEASSIVSMYQMYGNILLSGFPILFALFLGSWIDRNGTKLPMVFSIIGFALSNLFCAFLATQEKWSPIVLLFSGLPIALTGSVTAFLMSMLTFISKKTTEANRSFRIGVMESGWFVGFSSGVRIGSWIFEAYSYVPVFLTSAFFISLALIYIGIFMKEDPILSQTDEKEQKPLSGLQKFKDIFQLSSIKQTFHTCFRKRESSQRLWILLLVSMICLRVLAQDGSISLAYLYTRAKFGWDNANYSMYLQTEILMRFAGLLVMIGVINALKWKDTGLGIFSSFGYSVAHLVYAFAQSGWMMYLGAAIQTPCVLITILIRSAISKLVEKNELGRIFSLVAIGEACVPLVSSLIFNPIFSSTVHTFSGSIFLLSSALHGVICVQFLYLFFAMGKRKTESTEPLDQL